MIKVKYNEQHILIRYTHNDQLDLWKLYSQIHKQPQIEVTNSKSSEIAGIETTLQILGWT